LQGLQQAQQKHQLYVSKNKKTKIGKPFEKTQWANSDSTQPIDKVLLALTLQSE
jgi:hypothetical protein